MATYFFIVLLIFLSLYSWTLIFSFFSELYSLRKSLVQDRDFINHYQDKTEESLQHYFSSPKVTEIMKNIYERFHELTKKSLQTESIKASLFEGAQLDLQSFEVNRDHRLTKLATIASVSPYLGLLGTVLGVMQAFFSMSELQGALAMSHLAPGLAEALMATALGLFVAIPAQAAHYYFQSAFEKSQQSLVENSIFFLHEMLLRISPRIN
jgi:biopolymer transport protein TolQ